MSYVPPPKDGAPPAYTPGTSQQPYSPPVAPAAVAGEQSIQQHQYNGAQYGPPAHMTYLQDNSYEITRGRHQHSYSNASEGASATDPLKPSAEERGHSISPAPPTHEYHQTQKESPLHETEKAKIPGKYWLSRTRTYLYLMSWLCSVLCLVFGIMALFVYYWPTKDMQSKPVMQTSTGWSVVDRTQPGKEKAGMIISAWPMPPNLAPTLVQIGVAGTGVVYFLTVLGYPCFSSKKRYYKLTGFEIYEIIGAVVTFLLCIASFAYAKHSQYKKDLWGYACQRRADTTYNMTFGESRLFPTVKYAETCNDLNNVTYLLLVTGIIVFIAILTWIFGAMYAAGSKRRGYSTTNGGDHVVGGSATSALAATACCDGLLVCCLACTNCLTICTC